jgi:hypothetical protein
MPDTYLRNPGHGWPVFASVNRVPPGSAGPNVVLSGSEETADR